MYQQLSILEKKQHEDYFLKPLDGPASKALTTNLMQLSYFHTCRGQEFRDIFCSSQLAPTRCSEFDEDLLYVFYGKPSYRVPENGKASKDAGRFPVSFILKLEDNSAVSRVFPFDTGALINKVFVDVCGDNYNPAKYELGSELSQIAKFVSLFYGSDQGYFYAKPKPDVGPFEGFSYELQHILTLIKDTSDRSWDDRAHTIEVQCKKPISLSGGQVEAIILPSMYLNTEDLTDFLYANDIEPIPYDLERANPAHMTPLLISMAASYLKNKGVLHE